MEIKSSEFESYQTVKDQILVKIPREEQTSTSSSDVVFTMKSSTSKEVTKGTIVCSDSEHPEWVGKSCIIPRDNTIPLDTYTSIDDGDKYEYRIVQLKNVFLIEK